MVLNNIRFQIGRQFCKSKVMFHTPSAPPPVEFLEVGANEDRRKLAYQQIKGSRESGIFWIPGFLNGKDGTKATKLMTFCREQGFPYTRYDPAGIGESGYDMKNARFHHWIEDAENMLLRTTKGQQLVIGSSMGAWISLLLAQKYPEKFAGLILVAPGINFQDRFYKAFEKSLPKEIAQRLQNGETINMTYEDYGTFPASKVLLESFRPYQIDLSKEIKAEFPVRIIHGLKDKDVPYQEALSLLKNLSSKDSKLLYIKEGDHSLSSDSFFNDICNAIINLQNLKLSSKI